MSVFMPREWKDRCCGQWSDLCPVFQTMKFSSLFLWAVSSNKHILPVGGWRRWHDPPNITHETHEYFILRRVVKLWGHGAMIQLLTKPVRPEKDLFQKRNAYLTEQLIVVKYLESWNGGKSLQILALNQPADIQSPNGYTDIRVLRGASWRHNC